MRPLLSIPLLSLFACSSAAIEASHALRPPPSLSTVNLGEFSYIGPGSMGRFTDYALVPDVDGAMIAVADVGGVYLSLDDGASWENICRNLPTNGVWSVGFAGSAEAGRVVIGADSGIFVSETFDRSDGLDAEEIGLWTEASGIERGVDRADEDTMRSLVRFNDSRRTLPIGVITVDPQNTDLVWAAITAAGQMNLAQNPKDPHSLQHFDRWKLFRSTDGGVSFAPALRLSEPIPSFVESGFDVDGSVFSVLIDPTDSGRVWVAGDRGLYFSDNADTNEDADGDGYPDIRWSEIGVSGRRQSADLGLSWTATSPTCEDWAEGSAATAWCLPTIDEASIEYVIDPDTGWPLLGHETHPNLRSLSVSQVGGVERLYVSLWDRGHADDEGPGCDASLAGDSFVDADLGWLRGGVYASDDGGETWRWLLTDTGAPGADPGATPLVTTMSYRCDIDTSERNSDLTVSYFPDVKARPESDADWLLVGLLGANNGLWLYDATAAAPWTWLTDYNDSDFLKRFEGKKPLNLTGGNKVEVSRLLVDWDSETDGYPDIYFGARGILRGVWSDPDGWYYFDHLGSDYYGKIDGLHAWIGTGLDDAVIRDVAEYGGYLYVAASDGGLLRAEQVGDDLVYVAVGNNTWTANWSTKTGSLRKDECHAVVADEERGLIYASNAVSGTPDAAAVFAYDGSAWAAIGGYGYSADPDGENLHDAPNYNGFYSGSPFQFADVNDLLVVPPSTGFDVDLVAATEDGLWTYDADRAAGAQWEQLCPAMTDSYAFTNVNADLVLIPGYAFATNEDIPIGGLVAVDLDALTCAPIRGRVVTSSDGTETGQDPLRGVSAVAVTQDATGQPRLVVGGTWRSYVALFSGAVDCTAGCKVDEWIWSFSGDDLYDPDSERDEIARRFDITAIATDPHTPGVFLASLGKVPAFDYYNPQYLLASEDGGLTVERIDFETDDHGLPSRSLHQLEFSEDGLTLYAMGRSSLFSMPVSW